MFEKERAILHMATYTTAMFIVFEIVHYVWEQFSTT